MFSSLMATFIGIGGAEDDPAPESTDTEAAKGSLEKIEELRSLGDVQDLLSLLLDGLKDYMVLYAPRVLLALLWLIVGLFLVKLIVKLVGRGFKVRDVNESVQIFVLSVLRVGLRIILVIMVLGILGVPTASLGFIIGAASLAIGFALKDTLQNFAGGIIVLLLKPYEVGHYIEAQGFSGTVREIQIFNTILATSDNRRVIIPNGKLSTSSLINYSIESTRRVEVMIGIGYEDDIEQARSVLLGLINDDERTHHDPEPVVKVGALGDSSVDILARVWVDRSDFWAYRVELLEKVKQAFDREGISIPYPQTEVTVRQDGSMDNNKGNVE
ncbi:MAG: mechanosensitive ion channel [Phycisphaerales bacterium]|nr:mechanosensitive ion channel [Phycisphaerales bacterium]